MIMRRLFGDRSGSSAAEFAMVLPLLIILLFAIIDGGRWLWTYNRAEKATQMGARMAVVTNIPAAVNVSYVDQTCGGVTLTQGDRLPAGCFTTVTCTVSGCGAFDQVLARMQAFMPEIGATNLTVEYTDSGLGYAGNPNGPDASPLVTVSVHDLTFTPIVALALQSFAMPDFRASLTLEDAKGLDSN
jgi:Flp pilus assembly protein TadG